MGLEVGGGVLFQASEQPVQRPRVTSTGSCLSHQRRTTAAFFQMHGNNRQSPPPETQANSDNPCRFWGGESRVGTRNLYFVKWGSILGFPGVSFWELLL